MANALVAKTLFLGCFNTRPVEESRLLECFCLKDIARKKFLRSDYASIPRYKKQISYQLRSDDFEGRPNFIKDKLLSEVSTWGIGGPAKYFCEVHNEYEMAVSLRYCHKHSIRFFIVGKGSNCLFDDRGFDGCIILNRIDFVESNGNGLYHVGSGYPFNMLGIRCCKEGFSGLEFAGGIPGTVGGAVFMNAGANGQEMADVLKSVDILTDSGEKRTYDKTEDRCYGYRKSPFQVMEEFGAIISATFELVKCPTARDRQNSYLKRRRMTQPVTQYTAGCVFRNPAEGCSAGALIEKAGLKGFSIGEARVSELHANFMINMGKCKAADMLTLICLVKERVKSKFDIDLKEEICYVPFEGLIGK